MELLQEHDGRLLKQGSKRKKEKAYTKRDNPFIVN
jgi:hypothetical protein